MIVVYSARYQIDIGSHVFPTRKYHLLHERIRASTVDANIVEPQAATWEQLALVHSDEYLNKLQTGAFEWNELALLEIPWSPEVVEGFRLMTGGTIQAAYLALETGSPGFHIGGGFHHAFASHGEGFCLFNDVAVAIRVLLADAVIERAAVIDLDVHHGNGTAFIFESDPRVFTFSMHQEYNYPVHKPRGSLDIGLPDGTNDDLYLERLRSTLPEVMASCAANRVLPGGGRSIRGRSARRTGAEQVRIAAPRSRRARRVQRKRHPGGHPSCRRIRAAAGGHRGHSLRHLRGSSPVAAGLRDRCED